MKVVAVWSVKGGVGKTTTAVELAWHAAAEGRRVLVWDLDPQAGATWLLGAKEHLKVKGGAGAVVSGRRDARDGVRRTGWEGVDVLPADESYRDLELALDDAKASGRRIEKALGPLAKRYDLVVLDCPPGSSLLARNVVRAADVLVVPVVPQALALRSLDQSARVVADAAKPPRVVGFLSMVDRRKTAHRRAVEELPGQHAALTGVAVPLAAAVERMGDERAPVDVVAPRSPAAAAYGELWTVVRDAARL